MFGGDLPGNDAFTLALITNTRVLNVLKNSVNNRQLFNKEGLIAWIADDVSSGDKFLALFNTLDQDEIVEEKAAFSSGQVTKETQKNMKSVELELNSAKKLYLVVDDAGDGIAWDHADWIHPIFCNSTDTIELSTIRWIKASSGWGNVTVNKSVSGSGLIVNGISYSNGIGTHANSVIAYDIPEGFTRFRTGYGIDDAGTKQNSGATVKFMIFTEDPSGPVPPESSEVEVNFSQIGLPLSYKVQDLWSGRDLGTFKDRFSADLKRHASGIYRITPIHQ